MRLLTRSAFGSLGGGPASGSAAALLTPLAALALALVALLTLTATPAQGAERRAATIPVDGGKTSLKLDRDTAAALSDAGVAVEATGKAVGPNDDAVFRFPIVGGKVDKDPPGGQIVHAGGLAFSTESGSVKVRRFVIDLDRGVLTAEVAGAGQRIALLRLGAPKDVKVGPERLVLRGVDARLTAVAAGALNDALGTDLFGAGLPIGEATVAAHIGDD